MWLLAPTSPPTPTPACAYIIFTYQSKQESVSPDIVLGLSLSGCPLFTLLSLNHLLCPKEVVKPGLSAHPRVGGRLEGASSLKNKLRVETWFPEGKPGTLPRRGIDAVQTKASSVIHLLCRRPAKVLSAKSFWASSLEPNKHASILSFTIFC